VAVGALVFVAENFHDLEVAIEPPIINSCLKICGDFAGARRTGRDGHGWDEKVARTFWRGTREHGVRFQEAHLVHGFADFEEDLVAQGQIAVRFERGRI